jgi:hypothetical protein
MKVKALKNGYCLQCGNSTENSFCCRQCYREYIKSDYSNETEYEAKQRSLLTNRIIKRVIYIISKGSITYDMITPDMIEERRENILKYRQRKTEKAIQAKKKKEPELCIVCGKGMEGRIRGTKYCSVACMNVVASEKMRLKYRKGHEPKPFRCIVCGVYVIPKNMNQKRTCSEFCKKKYAKGTSGGNIHRKRAKLYGCEYEPFNPLKVFERDKWKCQLCGKKLNSKDRGKINDEAPELDHIIPMSKGGEHSRRNTQCACRRCNMIKGNREKGQLRLFG